MAFSESLKEEVRKKSDYTCVLCGKPFVEIHHIIPQAEGGSDTIDNAVALCAYCHDLIGANPTKRKQLKGKRDSHYEKVKAQKESKVIEKHHIYEKIKVVHKADNNDEKKIALYHVVYEDEDFNDAANVIINLLRECQQKYDNQKRVLYLDIEGHRLENGAFDPDMWELQYNFIVQNFMHYFSEIHLPLISFSNKYEQINELIPEDFRIYDGDNAPEFLKEHEGEILFTT